MATVTPDNLTVKFNLKGSVILDLDAYNELRLRADLYDDMLFSCIENFKVVDKEPSNWSPAACEIDGYFKIPTSIFNAVVNSVVSKLISNYTWMASIAKSGEHWLDLEDGKLSTYKPGGAYVYDMLDNKQFAEMYFNMQRGDSNE